MKIELYDQVILNQNVEDENLYRGDVATLVDYIEHPDGGEQGAILEIFNAIGDSIAVLSVPLSLIEPLSHEYILSARPLLAAA